jgi:hypothetical protein
MIQHDAIAQLLGDFRGTIHQPGEPGFDEARSVYNGMIERHPWLIAGAAQVRAGSSKSGTHTIWGRTSKDSRGPPPAQGTPATRLVSETPNGEPRTTDLVGSTNRSLLVRGFA